MKKIIMFFVLTVSLYSQSPDTIQVIVNPTTGSVLDTFTITVYVLDKSTGQIDTSYTGPVYFNIDNQTAYHLMDPTGASVYKGSVTVPGVRIYRAGNVAVYAIAQNGARGASSTLSLSPATPSRIQVLYENQLLIRGDTTIGGKAPFSPPSRVAGDTVGFRLFLTDRYYNPVSGNADIYLSSNDSLAEYIPDSTSVSDSAVVNVWFKIATNPPQFGGTDARILYVLPYDTLNFMGDTLAPSFQVNAGNYTKLLLLGPGERHFPGDLISGKKGTIPYLPSAIPFNLRVYVCDDYHNWLPGVNDNAILVFNPADTLIDTVPSVLNLSQGVDSFQVTIYRSGPYVVYALDQDIGRQSNQIILSIVGSMYISQVSPDTVLSGDPIHLTIRFVDPESTLVPHSHNIYLTPVLATNLQPASGTLTPQVVYLTSGTFDGNVTYTTNASEEIRIRITDSLGTGEHYTDYIYVAYLSSLPDTLINYPNPFGKVGSEITHFSFYLPRPARVKLYIYDLFGNLIKKFETNGNTGINQISWSGKNDNGKKVASGTYVVILKATSGAEKVLETKRLISVIR